MDAKAELLQSFSRFGPAWVRFLRSSASETSHARLRVLAALQAQGKPTIMRDLSESLELTPRAVTALVDALEADALVQRRPHPTDRRATLVELTEQGRQRAAALWSDHIARACDVLSVLDEQDAASLRRILELLTAELHRREQWGGTGGTAGLPACSPPP